MQKSWEMLRLTTSFAEYAYALLRMLLDAVSPADADGGTGVLGEAPREVLHTVGTVLHPSKIVAPEQEQVSAALRDAAERLRDELGFDVDPEKVSGEALALVVLLHTFPDLASPGEIEHWAETLGSGVSLDHNRSPRLQPTGRRVDDTERCAAVCRFLARCLGEGPTPWHGVPPVGSELLLLCRVRCRKGDAPSCCLRWRFVRVLETRRSRFDVEVLAEAHFGAELVRLVPPRIRTARVSEIVA